MRSQLLEFSLLTAGILTAAAPVHDLARALVDPYEPVQTACPTTVLVRPANGINAKEANYVSIRKTKADAGLSDWLNKQGAFDTSSLPAVGFASSGGGYRALLCTAGVIQGIDVRDSDLATSGLYQGLTYESGLSGKASS